MTTNKPRISANLNGTLHSFDLCGLVRYNDFVLLFRNTDRGKMFFLNLSMMKREDFFEFVGETIAAVGGSMSALNGPGVPHGIIFAKMENTTVPVTMPSHKFVGMLPEWQALAPNAPVFRGE
jgi:hypothetical protein